MKLLFSSAKLLLVIPGVQAWSGMPGGAGCLLWRVHSRECLPSQQAVQLHGGSSAGDPSGKESRRVQLKRGKERFPKALSYRHMETF